MTQRYIFSRRFSPLVYGRVYSLQVLEREKRRNLNGSQHKTSTPIDDAPGWNEGLASASEAHVKVFIGRVSRWQVILNVYP